jgi:hypothetical protein
MAIAATLLGAVAAMGIAIALVHGYIEGRRETAQETEDEAAIKAPQRVSVENGETVITLDDAAQGQGGIATAALRSGPRQETLRAYAIVLDVAPLTESSQAFATAKAQRQMAEAKLDGSRKAFQRATRLHQDDQNISTAQLQAAEAIYRVDEASLAAAQSQLQTLATSVQQAWGPVLGRALINDAPIARQLLTRASVLLQVTLPSGASIGKPPDRAFVVSDSGSRIDIRFVSPATRTDPRLQGASFLYTARGDSGLLPGMTVPAYLASSKAEEAVAVPASAIVWWQGRPWVYVRTSPTTFTRRELARPRAGDDGAVVASNLQADAEVVVQGAQMLLSEELRTQIRLTGEDQHR